MHKKYFSKKNHTKPLHNIGFIRKDSVFRQTSFCLFFINLQWGRAFWSDGLKKKSDSGKFEDCLSDSWIIRNSPKKFHIWPLPIMDKRKYWCPRIFVNSIKFKMHRLFEIWSFCWKFCTNYHLKSSMQHWFNAFSDFFQLYLLIFISPLLPGLLFFI